MNQRKQIRQAIKAKRAALTNAKRSAANHKIAQRIINSDLFKSSQHIACYMAKGAEVNLQEVIDAILASNKHCYLPLIRQDKSGLYFIEYFAGDNLQVGNFEILEPKFDKQKLIAPENLDLVLTPLVAFDMHGNRLGRGGGYYDRTFGFTSHPLLIGVAYACQQVLQIAAQPWDVKLHGVITEVGFKIF
ncbi:MAG: 5-formyltetrahydrofolate cyclo-ligase [Gammaproteobacteria bacterium]|jgi:5-formyltetrahydrofolate cyclo-ligase